MENALQKSSHTLSQQVKKFQYDFDFYRDHYTHEGKERNIKGEELTRYVSERVILHAVKHFLLIDGWKFRWQEIEPSGSTEISMNITGRVISSKHVSITYEKSVLVIFFPNIVVASATSSHLLHKVSQGLHHINRKLICGNFALDLTTKEISYRNYHTVQDGTLTYQQIHFLLYSSVSIVDDKFEVIKQLLHPNINLSSIDIVDGVLYNPAYNQIIPYLETSPQDYVYYLFDEHIPIKEASDVVL